MKNLQIKDIPKHDNKASDKISKTSQNTWTFPKREQVFLINEQVSLKITGKGFYYTTMCIKRTFETNQDYSMGERLNYTSS